MNVSENVTQISRRAKPRRSNRTALLAALTGVALVVAVGVGAFGRIGTSATARFSSAGPSAAGQVAPDAGQQHVATGAPGGMRSGGARVALTVPTIT
ncbi:MAG: hypothetical protein HY332_24410 [Chloroflexi bacterium]|nr:hypothetical protein [Chloroflexota bacterium]